MNEYGEFIWKEGKKYFGFWKERKKMDLVFFLYQPQFFLPILEKWKTKWFLKIFKGKG